MDQSVLVKAGHLIVKGLSELGLSPRAALWVHSTDTDTWKLWIVPHESLKDKREFYRHLVSIVANHRSELGGIDAADAEMIAYTHPLIQGMRGVFKATGESVINVKNSVFNGYYVEDAIIVEADLPLPRQQA